VKAGSSQTYPEPVSHCDICRWWKECDSQWRRDDHLSFVAGASRLQRKELTLQGVPSLDPLQNFHFQFLSIRRAVRVRAIREYESKHEFSWKPEPKAS